MGIWGPLAVAAILTEFLAPFFLVAGLLTRFAALALAILMTVAMGVHWGNGFFINWQVVPGVGNGVEFHILFIGVCVALMLIGSGRYSIDRLLIGRLGKCSCCSRVFRDEE